ncbi:winged helix-turn-helix domain-containing protein [Umezawaea sp. Da 62-37]|uniref:winged helix-turn-helix domain-containing protein n=1 Tax=Umezawaea sp. Da 62-37 TaxID=3075927 RepID=UPI0028F710F8|nr:winged helix-turn-helix domain-containing protein [Umezawaea sp. Da 62-37]WNV82955.1 winged helix-turn-helix domain-containing protein [Umezawaea sp. Da 62-37]
MRYGDGGGVGPQGRARREQIRRQAAVMFADGMSAMQVATALEVSTKSAYTWRRAWTAGGEQALASRGAPGPDGRLSQAQVQRLVAVVRDGPAAAGWAEDQRWTLARVRTLIGRMFHTTVGITTVWQVLHQAGFTPQQPVARAVERDEHAIEHWRRYQWPAVKGSRAGWARGSASPTSPASR